jgi:hypothetical protein
MGEAGRRRAVAFGPELFTERVFEAYRELLSGSRTER